MSPGEAACILRLRCRLTQRAAAKRLGMTPVHLCNIEKGASTLMAETRLNMHQLYNLDPIIAAYLWSQPTLADALNLVRVYWRFKP